VLVVIPFRAGGKSRLPSEIRTDVALAMLGDVIEAAVGVGDARVVTDDPLAVTLTSFVWVALGSAATLMSEKDEEIGCLSRPTQHERLAARILRENPFIHPTVMIRRSYLEMCDGYDARLKRSPQWKPHPGESWLPL
jgi:hypothetical protein